MLLWHTLKSIFQRPCKPKECVPLCPRITLVEPCSNRIKRKVEVPKKSDEQCLQAESKRLVQSRLHGHHLLVIEEPGSGHVVAIESGPYLITPDIESIDGVLPDIGIVVDP